jgi:hypothetical protein
MIAAVVEVAVFALSANPWFVKESVAIASQVNTVLFIIPSQVLNKIQRAFCHRRKKKQESRHSAKKSFYARLQLAPSVGESVFYIGSVELILARRAIWGLREG